MMEYNQIIELLGSDIELVQKVKQYFSDIEASEELTNIEKNIKKNMKDIDPESLNELLNSIENFKIVSDADMVTTHFKVSFNMLNIEISMGSDSEANRGGGCYAAINDMNIVEIDSDHPHLDIGSCDEIDESNREQMIELFKKTFPKIEPDDVLCVIVEIFNYWLYKYRYE